MKITESGSMAGSGRTWIFETAGEVANTFGYDLTIFVGVDPVNGDTITIEGSVDKVNWVAFKSYTESSVEVIPAMPYVKASWGNSSVVHLSGMRHN